MLDLVIRDGTVLDGSGAPGRRADIGIRGGRVTSVGVVGERGATEIDAEGRIVTPGFIDIHAHDDFNLPLNPQAHGKVTQGVTTVVNGNCGLSPAPFDPARLAAHRDIMASLDSGLDYRWPTLGAFLDDHPPCGVNVCQLVGHHAVRCAVMGMAPRAPTAGELDRMRAHVDAAMRAGAFGLSTGLFGPPGGHADADEVVALAGVAAHHGGGYFTHMRNEGARVTAAIDEAIDIGRRAGAAVQISHLKVSDPGHHGIAPDLLARIHAARDDGLDIHCDQYPYAASSGGLRFRLPPWAQAGETGEILARLRDPSARERLRHDLEEGMARDRISMRIYDWSQVRIGMSPTRPEVVGLTLAALGERDGKRPADALLDLLLADRLATRGIYFHMSEADVRAIMRDPLVAIGSDGLYTGLPGQPDHSNPHPRHYGTFARVLGHYVREEGVLGLADAVRKMTALPAHILGLADRGILTAGAAADLAVLDPEGITDRATFDHPHREAEGVDDVIVNGVAVLRDGRATGAVPGQVLRHRAGARR